MRMHLSRSVWLTGSEAMQVERRPGPSWRDCLQHRCCVFMEKVKKTAYVQVCPPLAWTANRSGLDITSEVITRSSHRRSWRSRSTRSYDITQPERSGGNPEKLQRCDAG